MVGVKTDLSGVKTVRWFPHETHSGRLEARLEKVEERLDNLALKWLEQDEEIHKLKRRQA